MKKKPAKRDKRVVHKSWFFKEVIMFPDRNLTLCCRFVGDKEKVAINWKHVTCKRCLAKRGK